MERNDQDKLSQFWIILSNAMPPVGLALYLRHRRQSPNKAQRALVSALIGVPVAIAGGYILNNFIFV